ADRHPGRDRADARPEGALERGRPAAPGHPLEAVLPPAGRQPPVPARRRPHHRHHRHRRPCAGPRHPAHPRHREGIMSTTHVLPVPASTYQLLRDAAHTWPDAVATQWIPDPAAYTDCSAWTYTDLAGHVTQIANALAALGVRRADAVTLCGVNTSTLYAATLAAQAVGIAAPVNPVLSAEHLPQLIRRTGSRVVVAAGPELDEARWERLLAVCAEVDVRAVLVLRPDAVTGAPPALPGVPGM